MSVVVYRDGIMACDGGLYYPHGRIIQNFNKIMRSKKGVLYGFTGPVHAGHRYLRWVSDGCINEPPSISVPNSKDYINIIKAEVGKPIQIISEDGYIEFSGDSYYAIGSACDYALGALHHGASAIEAVEASIAHCDSASLPIYSIRHEDQ